MKKSEIFWNSIPIIIQIIIGCININYLYILQGISSMVLLYLIIDEDEIQYFLIFNPVGLFLACIGLIFIGIPWLIQKIKNANIINKFNSWLDEEKKLTFKQFKNKKLWKIKYMK